MVQPKPRIWAGEYQHAPAMRFACIACNKVRPILGRRQRTVRGAKVLVCADCISKEPIK